MTHHLYFLVFTFILIISAIGLIYFSQQFFEAQEKFLLANLQANLLTLQLNKVERALKFLQEKPIILLFVGDIMLSRGVANQIKKHQDFRYPFLKIADFLREADMVFGNLEGPISSRGKNRGGIYSFRADPGVIEGLKFAGFDVLSLANNHIWDWGEEALIDTIDILKANGIKTIGAGKNYEEANRAVIIDFNSRKSSFQKLSNVRVELPKIAFLAYTNLLGKNFQAQENKAGISNFNIEEIKNKIKYLKESQAADIIVISLHWGEEYQNHSNSSQRMIAYSLVEAGANLIIGHHPHVIQETERYQNGWIAYSLGNFIFDQNFSKETMTGLMLKVVVKEKKVSEIVPIEIKINNTFQPAIIGL